MTPSLLTQHRQQIGQFENRHKNTRILEKALESEFSRTAHHSRSSNRACYRGRDVTFSQSLTETGKLLQRQNDGIADEPFSTGNMTRRSSNGVSHSGRTVTVAKAMLGAAIAFSVMGMGSTAVSASVQDNCLDVSPIVLPGNRGRAVKVDNSCDWKEAVIFKEECIKKSGMGKNRYEIMPHENTTLPDVKGWCSRKGRWKEERVHTETEVMCKIADGSGSDPYVKMAREWVGGSGTSCSDNNKADKEERDMLKDSLVKCYKLDGKSRSGLGAEEKGDCYSGLEKIQRLTEGDGDDPYNQMFESGKTEFDPARCDGNINLTGLGGMFSKVGERLTSDYYKGIGEKFESAQDVICEKSKGPEGDAVADRAWNILKNNKTPCPDTGIPTKEELIKYQDKLIECIGYHGVKWADVSLDQRRDCYIALEEISGYIAGLADNSNHEMSAVEISDYHARSQVLKDAAKHIYYDSGESHVNLYGFKATMGEVFAMISDHINSGDKSPSELTQKADEMLCGFSFGVVANPYVEMAKQWVDNSGMNCTSVFESDDKTELKELKAELLECIGFDGRPRISLPAENKLKCQQMLTDASFVMRKFGNDGVKAGMATTLENEISEFDLGRCDGSVNLHAAKGAMGRVNQLISERLAVGSDVS